MGVFEQPEWTNFVTVNRFRLYLWPRYLIGICLLIIRRVGNAVRWRIVRAPHRGLKQWPKWLGDRRFTVRAQRGSSLAFPEYPPPVSPDGKEGVPAVTFPPGDCESHFARQRWGECLAAALDDCAKAEKALEKTLDWMRCPPGKADPAWEPYSSSERVANLLVLLAVHPQLWRSLGDADRILVTDFLVESAQWIHDHLEYYGEVRTNNHILNDARALVLVAAVIGDRQLLNRGLKLFITMSRQLFCSGGTLRERSSHYQCVVANWLADVTRFANFEYSNGTMQGDCDELFDLSRRVLPATRVILRGVADADCHFGDISPDSHPVATEARLDRLYSDYFPGAADVGSGRLDDWILVNAGQNRIMTCGVAASYPISYTTHGHSDLGGFAWALNGRPILVDRGRASYNREQTNLLQCSAMGHTTILVNGLPALCESLLSAGRWVPEPYGRAFIDFRTTDQGFSLKHDGFSRIPGGGAFRRQVMADGVTLSVIDEMDGTGEVTIDRYWHFAPGLNPCSDDAPTLSYEGLEVDIVVGESTKEIQWRLVPHSTAYGEGTVAYCLRLSGKVKLPWSETVQMTVSRCVE